MKWIYCNKKDFISVNKLAGVEKYEIALTPTTNTKRVDKDLNYDTKYILIYVNHYPSVEELKKYLLDLQQQYDISNQVNGFYLNNKFVWFDKNTRVGLVNAFNMQKANGEENTTIWFSDTPIELTIDKALYLMAQLEIYALSCYNVTQQHIANIKNLNTLEECLSFDITADYPKKLNIII